MTKARKNLPAQERAVIALWRFAEDLQDPALVHDATAPGCEGRTISVNLESVGRALTTIMKGFGYVVTPID